MIDLVQTLPRTVLLVDDEAMVRSLLGLVLRRAGYAVLEAADGAEAVEMYLRHGEEIGLVLLDVEMPVMGGPEAMEAILQVNPDVPCCFLTGHAERRQVMELVTLGARAVLGKPFDLGALVRLVKSHFARPRSPQSCPAIR